jgi:hypothetical protein
VLWIYCDYRDEHQQTAVNVIGALLKQVIIADPNAYDPIIQSLERMQKNKRQLDLETAYGLLGKALQRFDKVYICIDALDEFQEHRSPFLRSLNILLEWRDSLKIFLTSRPHVEPYAKDHTGSSVLSSVTLEASKTDIIKYLESQIDSDDAGVEMGLDFREEAVDTIISASDGIQF